MNFMMRLRVVNLPLNILTFHLLFINKNITDHNEYDLSQTHFISLIPFFKKSNASFEKTPLL